MWTVSPHTHQVHTLPLSPLCASIEVFWKYYCSSISFMQSLGMRRDRASSWNALTLNRTVAPPRRTHWRRCILQFVHKNYSTLLQYIAGLREGYFCVPPHSTLYHLFCLLSQQGKDSRVYSSNWTHTVNRRNLGGHNYESLHWLFSHSSVGDCVAPHKAFIHTLWECLFSWWQQVILHALPPVTRPLCSEGSWQPMHSSILISNPFPSCLLPSPHCNTR